MPANSFIPLGGTPVAASSGNVANAVATATIPAVSGRLNYITGLYITGSGATSGAAVSVTITGLVGGTQTYTYTAATGAALANTPLQINFPTPIQATGLGVAIVVSCPALGAGNTNNTVVVTGFYE